MGDCACSEDLRGMPLAPYPKGYPEGVGPTDLFWGNPGVVSFLLECHHMTGDPSYLDAARDGAEELLHAIRRERQLGLYVGRFGMAFALLETCRATDNERF